MTSLPNNFKCCQWNARGLTRSRLEEFKHFLSYYNPSVVLLCETHWNDSFNVRFNAYNVIKKNRPNQNGGGVAILAHKSLQFSSISLPHFSSLETVGISISFSDSLIIDFVSVYAPRGDSSEEEINRLLNRPNMFFVGGDFNAHHNLW